MKNLFYTASRILLLMIVFCFSQCKKEQVPSNEQHIGLNITLHDKPLDTIRYYLQGMWYVYSTRWQVSSGYVIDSNRTNTVYWKIASGDRITQFYDGLIGTDTTINWSREKDLYNGDSTFIMNFYNKGEHLLSYAVDSIFNDTLVLHANKIDAGIIYFIKKNEVDTGLSISLFDKPLDVIQSSIQGRWKCHYGKGGIASNMVQYFDSYFWTFFSNNRIEQFYNGTIVTDTTIEWKRGKGTWTNVDSTFIMNFYDKQNVPWAYIVDGFFNDTLILHNNYADAVFYHFTKL